MTLTLLCFVFAVGIENHGKIASSNILGNFTSHLTSSQLSTNNSKVQVVESRKKIQPLPHKLQEAHPSKIGKIATASALPSHIISRLTPTMTYVTAASGASSDEQGDTFADRGIPVPSLLELLRVKVPRSGNVENRKKEEILLRLDKDYTTSQIADYVHKTGDERGISQLFIDMIHDGQASRDDVIRFLEHVQRQLHKINLSQIST